MATTKNRAIRSTLIDQQYLLQVSVLHFGSSRDILNIFFINVLKLVQLITVKCTPIIQNEDTIPVQNVIRLKIKQVNQTSQYSCKDFVNVETQII